MTERAQATVLNSVRRWNPAAEVLGIHALTPDASLRRYFRVTLGNPKDSIVAMVFDSVLSAEAGGRSVTSDRSYVELTRFFSVYGIRVPELLFDDEAQQLLLIEDLGDCLLANLLLEDCQTREGDRRAELVEELYRSAIEQIERLQAIPPKKGFFPFERSFTAELYRRELSEFEDYVLRPAAASPELINLSRATFSFIAQELARLPQVLVHRDFHSWNLMVDAANGLRVIDFQDALMATRSYDLVGLLNDRDTDSALGFERYRRLLHYFYERTGATEEFWAEYDLVLLQRDLKVAGRFNKLSRERGLTGYEKWVPGTQRRIGETLARLARRDNRWCLIRDALASTVLDVARGVETGVEFC